ncbi:MAG: hypothetical protein O7G87_15980 [bacterium]|nr:hypothetical protein [bacterium]
MADQGVEDFASCKFGAAQNEHHAGAVVGEVAFHVGEGDAVGSSEVFGFRVVENSEPDGERGGRWVKTRISDIPTDIRDSL